MWCMINIIFVVVYLHRGSTNTHITNLTPFVHQQLEFSFSIAFDVYRYHYFSATTVNIAHQARCQAEHRTSTRRHSFLLLSSTVGIGVYCYRYHERRDIVFAAPGDHYYYLHSTTLYIIYFWHRKLMSRKLLKSYSPNNKQKICTTFFYKNIKIST